MNSVTEHFKLVVDKGQIWLDVQNNPVIFRSLKSLINHYQHYPLDHLIASIGMICKSSDYEYLYLTGFSTDV